MQLRNGDVNDLRRYVIIKCLPPKNSHCISHDGAVANLQSIGYSQILEEAGIGRDDSNASCQTLIEILQRLFSVSGAIASQTASSEVSGEEDFPCSEEALDNESRSSADELQPSELSGAEVFAGSVLFKKGLPHKDMPDQLLNPRVVLINDSIGYDSRNGGEMSSLDALHLQEQKYTEIVVQKLLLLEPELIIASGSISNLAMKALLQKKPHLGTSSKGVAVLANVKLRILYRVSRCTGALILPSIHHIDKMDTRHIVGYARKFYVRREKQKTARNRLHQSTDISFADATQALSRIQKSNSSETHLAVIEGASTELVGTIVLYGDKKLLRLLKRIIRWGLQVAYHLRTEANFFRDSKAIASPICYADEKKLKDFFLAHQEESAFGKRFNSLEDFFCCHRATMLSSAASMQFALSSSPSVRIRSPLSLSHVLNFIVSLSKRDFAGVASMCADAMGVERSTIFKILNTPVALDYGVALTAYACGFHREQIIPEHSYVYPSLTESMINERIRLTRCWLAEGRVLGQPESRLLEFYAHDDFSLGQFLEYVCFSDNVVQRLFEEKHSASSVSLTMTHGDKRLHVSVSEMPASFSTSEHKYSYKRMKVFEQQDSQELCQNLPELSDSDTGILTWLCGHERQKSPCLLSRASWQMSFAKYLELLFHGESHVPVRYTNDTDGLNQPTQMPTNFMLTDSELRKQFFAKNNRLVECSLVEADRYTVSSCAQLKVNDDWVQKVRAKELADFHYLAEDRYSVHMSVIDNLASHFGCTSPVTEQKVEETPSSQTSQWSLESKQSPLVPPESVIDVSGLHLENPSSLTVEKLGKRLSELHREAQSLRYWVRSLVLPRHNLQQGENQGTVHSKEEFLEWRRQWFDSDALSVHSLLAIWTTRIEDLEIEIRRLADLTVAPSAKRESSAKETPVEDKVEKQSFIDQATGLPFPQTNSSSEEVDNANTASQTKREFHDGTIRRYSNSDNASMPNTETSTSTSRDVSSATPRRGIRKRAIPSSWKTRVSDGSSEHGSVCGDNTNVSEAGLQTLCENENSTIPVNSSGEKRKTVFDVFKDSYGGEDRVRRPAHEHTTSGEIPRISSATEEANTSEPAKKLEVTLPPLPSRLANGHISLPSGRYGIVILVDEDLPPTVIARTLVEEAYLSHLSSSMNKMLVPKKGRKDLPHKRKRPQFNDISKGNNEHPRQSASPKGNRRCSLDAQEHRMQQKNDSTDDTHESYNMTVSCIRDLLRLHENDNRRRMPSVWEERFQEKHAIALPLPPEIRDYVESNGRSYDACDSTLRNCASMKQVRPRKRATTLSASDSRMMPRWGQNGSFSSHGGQRDEERKYDKSLDKSKLFPSGRPSDRQQKAKTLNLQAFKYGIKRSSKGKDARNRSFTRGPSPASDYIMRHSQEDDDNGAQESSPNSYDSHSLVESLLSAEAVPDFLDEGERPHRNTEHPRWKWADQLYASSGTRGAATAVARSTEVSGRNVGSETSREQSIEKRGAGESGNSDLPQSPKQVESAITVPGVIEKRLANDEQLNKWNNIGVELPCDAKRILRSQTRVDVAVMFQDYSKDAGSRIDVLAVWAPHFHALRCMYLESPRSFVESLTWSSLWSSGGGKSGAGFWKTEDERFVVKEVNEVEFNDMFGEHRQERAYNYFCHMADCFDSPEGSGLLIKILGAYRISLRGNKRNKRDKARHVVVMENLFYSVNIQRGMAFDLKGKERKFEPEKVAQATGSSNQVLFDSDLLAFTGGNPITLTEDSHGYLMRQLKVDTSFLRDQDIMDYSLLLGVDVERKKIVVGIIDYLRTYGIVKFMESHVKSITENAPTVQPPHSYQKRLLQSAEKYFMAAPTKLSTLDSQTRKLYEHFMAHFHLQREDLSTKGGNSRK